MSSILIKNACLVNSVRGTENISDIYINNGFFDTNTANNKADIEIDATGLTAIPGLVDIYARLREPGQEKKATIANETRAAIHGGITTLLCSPDTDPVIDETATVELIHRRAEDAGYARVIPLAALTQQLAGERISELATLHKAGCVAASNAEKPITSTRVLRSVMEYASTFDIQLVFIAQDAWLAGNGVIHEGKDATQMGLEGIPVVAETIALSMLIELAWQTGAKIHFSRITSGRGINLIRDAKARGLPITVDTSINHLLLSTEDTRGFNSLCHINPPLRTIDDRNCLQEAIKDGTLDAICTDHAPHEPDAKLAPFPSSEPGISGLDIFLPLLIKVATSCRLDLHEILALASNKPAAIFKLCAGTIESGRPADLVLFDRNQEFYCEPSTFVSKGKNSPYQGYKLQGKVKYSFISGEQIAF